MSGLMANTICSRLWQLTEFSQRLMGRPMRRIYGQGPNPNGLCQCGCGEATPLASKSNTGRGAIKGQPQRYVQGHESRRNPQPYVVNLETGCWDWNRYLQPAGYGITSLDRKQQLAHRVFYQIWIGPIPDGYDVHHRCANRHCVNPAHLQALEHIKHMALHAAHRARKKDRT